MADYTSNFAALLTGHLGLTGDPTTGGGAAKAVSGSDKYNPQGRTPLNDSLDIRDVLSHVIAGGYTDFSNKDVQANYKYLSHLVGVSKAERLFVQAFSFNKKPGNNKQGGAEKVQQFFDTGSSDPETNKAMVAVKNLNMGDVKRGFQDSANEGVKLLNKSSVPSGKKQSEEAMASIQDIANKKIGQ